MYIYIYIYTADRGRGARERERQGARVLGQCVQNLATALEALADSLPSPPHSSMPHLLALHAGGGRGRGEEGRGGDGAGGRYSCGVGALRYREGVAVGVGALWYPQALAVFIVRALGALAAKPPLPLLASASTMGGGGNGEGATDSSRGESGVGQAGVGQALNAGLAHNGAHVASPLAHLASPLSHVQGLDVIERGGGGAKGLMSSRYSIDCLLLHPTALALSHSRAHLSQHHTGHKVGSLPALPPLCFAQ